MSWAIGLNRWNRDIGYGVPAFCDYPGCEAVIDRGLFYVCGDDVGEDGCGLYFCAKHLAGSPQRCERCEDEAEPFTPTPDHPEWVNHKMTDESWAQWRQANPGFVKANGNTIECTFSITRERLIEIGTGILLQRWGNK